MLSKLESDDELYDHEVLEILLYAVSPRMNTNPVAHRLLDRFCSISGILKADVAELKEVEGVGENTAIFIRTIGLCAERAGNIEGVAVLKNLGDAKDFVRIRMRGKTEEFLELYFLTKSGRVNRIFSYTSADRNKVVTNADEIIKSVAVSKPYGILIAHNHLNGNVEPSANDEIFTEQMQLICNMNNVNLWDHLIYSDGNFYSYRDGGKMEEISRKYSLTNVLKWINNSN